MAKQKPTLNEADLDLIEKRFEKKFATKNDLKRFATKDDLKRFATKDDLQQLENRMDDRFEEQGDRFERKLTEFKNEFFDKIDPILKEVLASREERTIIAHHISELRTRVEKIEKHLGLAA